MTKYFILAASLVLLFVGLFSISTSAKTTKKNSTHYGVENSAAPATSKEPQSKTTPASPIAKAPMPVEKHQAHTPHIDETPHIHHYHKGRVRKLKKHHSKIWFFSMFLLVVCQISLLIIAYLHVIH